MRFRRKIHRAVIIAILLAVVLATFFPFYFLIVSSLKNNPEIAASPFLLLTRPRWSNYALAFEKVARYMGNSIIVSGTSVLLTTLISLMSAYVFARFEFPFKNALFTFIISFLMIPGVLTLIPMYVLVSSMKLMGTFWSVILPFVATAQITFLIIVRSFIEELPRELFESARVDGASHVQIFLRIVFPMTKATVFSMALMTFLNSWNDFQWPLLCLGGNEPLKTITLGLYSFRDVQQIQYGPMFAGFIIASIPLIILFCSNMRHFIAGITAGAIKG